MLIEETVAGVTDSDEMKTIIASVQELKRIKEEQDRERYEKLCKLISSKRDEAIKAKTSSGIEDIWREDQEHYEGIDDHNRAKIKLQKPASPGGALSTPIADKSTQCVAFFNITRQFVDSAAARTGDILLPAGDWNWGVKKSPVSDVPGPEAGVGPVDAAEQNDSAVRVRLGEERIKDWLVETRYHKEYRKAIESAARIGTGILKGPYPVSRKTRAMMNGALVLDQRIFPATRAIDPDNFFPDPNCGDDIQKGDYVFERDFLTYKQLSDLKELDDYLPDSINRVLREGPGRKYSEQEQLPKDNDLFEVWYGICTIDINDMDLIDDRYRQDVTLESREDGTIEIMGVDEFERDKEFQSVVTVIVNDTIIKGHMNPLDNGEYPYDVMCWQRMDNSPFGVGIARQMRVAQNLLNSSARNLVDNMALSAIPMLAMRRSGVEPENGKWEIVKGKVWWLTDEAIRSIQEAVQFLQIPNMQKELMEIMLLAGKMAEDATGVNSLLQGQQGSAPDTVGGMELLHKNASALLRRIARVSDEDVTEPHIRRYYDWLLVYGDDSEKGDFEIEAIGSTVLVEREIQAMQAEVLLNYSQDPSYGLSKPKIMSEIIKGWKMDANRVMMDDKEKQALAEQQAQPPADPRLQIEQMRLESAQAIHADKMQIEQQKAQIAAQNEQEKRQVDMEQLKIDQDRELLFSQGVAERNRIDYQARIAELELKERIAMLEYSLKNQMQLNDVKAQLSQTVMKLNATKELAQMNATADKLPKPPIEPPGTAAPGRSFQE